MASSGTVVVGVNFTRAQAYMALIVQSIAILSAALGLALWVGRVLVRQEFQGQLETFHTRAVPQIEQMMDTKILALAKEREVATAEVREDVSGRLSALEEHAKNTDSQLDRIEDKLDRALR